MKTQYADWIERNVPDNCLGKCAEVTEEMQKVFPELTRVRGHYLCLIWGARSHWWLVDPDGEIVDPTARQFPTQGLASYVPWEEGAEEPTGKCPNCGGYCYGGDQICSEECESEYVRYLQGEGRF